MLKNTFILLVSVLCLYRCVFADSSSCGYPPRIKNGFPIVGNRTHPGRNHGDVVTYLCRGNKVLVKKGEVICHFGHWIGDLPECKDFDDRTDISSTTKAPSQTSPHHNEAENIEGNCGYPPRIQNGYPIVDNRTRPGRNHGAVVTYACRGSKVLVDRGKVECSFGKWVGILPECKDIDDDHTDLSSATMAPSQTSSHHEGSKNIESSCNYPPRIKNGFPIVGNRTHPGRNHGDVVTYVCRGNKVLVKTGEVICQFGQWVGDPPECKGIDDNNTEKPSTINTRSKHLLEDVTEERVLNKRSRRTVLLKMRIPPPKYHECQRIRCRRGGRELIAP